MKITKFKSAIKYLVVGGSTALLELMFFSLFSFVLPLAVSNVFAVVISTICNFLLNKFWSFNQRNWSNRSLVLYILLFLFNTSFSSIFITVLAGLGVIPVFAKIISMACIVIWNYFLYQRVIFK